MSIAISRIPMFSTFNGNYVKPSDILDPNKKKTEEYALPFCEFIYAQYYNNYSAIKENMAYTIARNRSYATGSQDTSQYKNWIFGSSDDKPNIPINPATEGLVNELRLEDTGLVNINFNDIYSPLPKYIDNIIGIFDSVNHNINVQAIDENSGTSREELKFGAYVTEQLKAFLTRFSVSMGIPLPETPPVLPQSIQELELFENIGAFKLPTEIAMEKLIIHTNNLAKMDDETKKELIYDGLVDGFQCVVVEQDTSSGKFIPKRADVLEIVLEDSRRADFSDSTWGGLLEWYTAHQLRIETGWDEEDIQQLVGTARGLYGNPEQVDYSIENGQYGYDDFRIPILHCFWKSIDSEYYSERESEKGKIRTYEPYTDKGTKPPKSRKSRKLEKVDIRRLYHAKWVIGSKKVFDNGIVTNSPYNFGKNDVEFPIQLYRLKGKPKIQSMIPIEDQIQLTFYKMQNNIAKATPSGAAIEWGALKNLQYGKKQKISPIDAYKIYKANGDLLYQAITQNIPGANTGQFSGPPVKELKGTLGFAVTEGISALEFFYSQLDKISGLDAISMANASPTSNTRKGVAEMASAATSNTLRPLYSGYLHLKINSAKVVMWQAVAMMSAYTIKDIDENPYFSALGRANLTALLTASKYPPTVYGLNPEAVTSDFEKQQFLASAQKALAGGKNGNAAISYSEYAFIVEYLNSKNSIKYLRLWMAKKEQERRLEAQKIANENSILMAKKEQEVAQVKIQGEKELLDMQTQSKIQIIQAEVQGKKEILALEIQAGKTFSPKNFNTSFSNS